MDTRFSDHDPSDRKLDEDAIRSSGVFLWSALDAFSSHVAILDENGCILAVNKAWRDFAQSNGVDPSRVCEGANYLGVCDQARGDDCAEARQVAAAIRTRLRDGHGTYRCEYPCHSPDEKRWFTVRVTRFLSGRLPRVVVTHDTITERRLAEEALLESEARYRAIFEMSTEGILLTKPDGSVLAANPEACRIFGRSESEICAAGRDGLVDLTDPQLPILLSERAATGRAKGKLTLLRKDGTPFPAELSSGTFRDQQGNLMATIVVRDITERKRAEEAVQRSEALLRTITDNIPHPIFLKDRDCRMLFANPATFAVIGKPAEAVIGKPDAEFYDDPAMGNALMDNDRRVMETGRSQSIEENIPGPNGPRTFLSTKSPYRDAQGRVIGVVGAAHDITERKRTEESLRLHENELAQMNRLNTVGEMAAALAHELNQPLYAINNYVGGMERLLKNLVGVPDADRLVDAVTGVSREVTRAAAIIRRLQEFVRGRDPHRSSVDLARSVRQAAALMEPMARSKGAFLTLLTGDNLPLIQADPIQIEQVIVNLVANAIDAVAGLPLERRKVTVEARSAGVGLVEVAVHDRGRGIPAELRKRLFEAFFSTKKEGLGVGLTISRSIVHAHGGKIWAVHHEPHGTSFHFTLPLTQVEEEPHHVN